MTDITTYCDVNTCEECPRYGDDCDGDKRVEHADLISRADAMAYPLSWEHYDKENGSREFICGVESYREYIEALPSADAEWISCSKGLPRDLLRVNVTWINHNPPVYYQHIKDIPQTDTALRYNGNWYWWDSTVIDVLAEYGEESDVEQINKDIEVVAWMPLPMPYREDGEA